MSNINQLSSAIKFALFVGATATLATASAFAQEAAKEIDAVNVVGSKIKRIVDEETAQPVQVLTRADIERTGLNNVYEILNSITSSDGSGLSTVTTQTNGSDGSQQVSLRGLGAQRTLVLVDGKRWVTDIDGTVDFSTIPVAIIQRIEVLKDGASAIYGSDAIAGVINIVTRKDYDGAQAGLYYGQTTKSDGGRRGADLTIGAKGERTNGVLSISHTSQESIFAADREISQYPLFGNYLYGYAGGDCPALLAGAPDTGYGPHGTVGGFCGSASGVYGNFTFTLADATAAGLPTIDNSVPPNGLDATQSYALNPGANLADGIQVTDYQTFRNFHRYNFAPINYLQQPAKRTNVFVAGSFDLTDNVSAFARASYTKRTSDQQLAPVPLTIRNDGSAGPAWDFAIAATSVFNPFGRDINSANYRMEVAGPRHNFFDYDIFSLQLGLEGNFELGGRGFNWELSAQRNDGQYDQRGENYVNLLNLRSALGPSYADATGLHCGVLGTPIANCTPFGITLGPTAGVGTVVPNGLPGGYTVTQADVDRALAYVTYTLVDQTGITSTNYGGNISGELFDLPGGMMAFAFGFETRRDNIFYQPDALVAGSGSSNNFSEATNGSTSVDELYLEVVAPVLKDVTAFQELEFNAAVRKSDYKASGLVGSVFTENDPGSPTNAKFGMKWKPIDDLLVRFSWGETFRAPSANDLYGGGAESFPAVQDPCNTARYNSANMSAAGRAICNAGGVPPGGVVQLNAQLRALVGGNSTLKPEFGVNRTAGLVYSPSWLEGFNISLDYWKVDLEDALAVRGAGQILNLCHGFGAGGVPGTPDPSFCAFVTRIPTTGEVAVIRSTSFNLNSQVVSGYDLGVGYNFGTGFGDFRIKWDTTYTAKNEANGTDLVGFYNGSPNWEYRSTLDLGWSKGDWSASWTTRAMSDIVENCFFYCNQRNGDALNHTGTYAVHDVQFGWKAPWDAKVAVGARNVFGREPPILTNNTFAHSFDASYDLPGGAYWYAQYRQDF
jgi:iron complex outermembrane receptor protein